MVRAHLFVLALCVFTPALASASMISVIVEFTDPPIARMVSAPQLLPSDELAALRQQLQHKQDRLLADWRSQGLDFEVRSLSLDNGAGGEIVLPLRYDLVLNGINLLIEQQDLTRLRAAAGVKAVHADRFLQPQLQSTVDYIHATDLSTSIQGGLLTDSALQGQGIHVAIIDSGIDWTHPMLGGPLAPPPRLGLLPADPEASANDKVVYSLPLAEIVLNDGTGHGTHVASIAAGYPVTVADPSRPGFDTVLHGVAPQARLMSYKVCNDINTTLALFGAPALQCLSSMVMLAIEDAVSPSTLTGFEKPVADVINISLGGEGGPDDVTALAADNAVLMGAVVVAAAGNTGPEPATMQSPAAGRQVIAVGASNDPGVGVHEIEIMGAPDSRPLAAALAPHSNLLQDISEPISAHYVFAGLADTPDQVPNTVAGQICLMVMGDSVAVGRVRSGILANKALQCAAKGAAAAILYNNEPGEIGDALIPATIPVFTLSGSGGDILNNLGYADSGLSRHRLTIHPFEPTHFVPSIVDFSARGPVPGQIKPDVLAPGLSVLAAAPALSVNAALGVGNYVSLSGTSMAAPHVTGAVALIRQAHPDWPPVWIRTALINTATELRDQSGVPQTDRGYSAMDQGGGLIHVRAAVNTQALLGVRGDDIEKPDILGSHVFSAQSSVQDACRLSMTTEITIMNLADEQVLFDLNAGFDGASNPMGSKLELSSHELQVAANAAGHFMASLHIDDARASVDADNPQTLSGEIIAESKHGLLRMPWAYSFAEAQQNLDSSCQPPSRSDLQNSGFDTRGGALGCYWLFVMLILALVGRSHQKV